MIPKIKMCLKYGSCQGKMEDSNKFNIIFQVPFKPKNFISA